jgi:hypothetical protein
MRALAKTAAVAGLVGLACTAAGALDWAKASPPPDNLSPTVRAKKTIERWPADSRLLAERLLEELGAPDEVMPHYITWQSKKPFVTTTLFADRASSNQPGILSQSVPYRVPVGRWRALSAFGKGVSYDVVFNELVAVNDNPEANLLALNLADEVIQSKRTPDEARSYFDQTLTRSYAGKGSPYLELLRFDPSSRRVGR